MTARGIDMGSVVGMKNDGASMCIVPAWRGEISTCSRLRTLAADRINRLIDQPPRRRLLNENQLRRSVLSISANIAEGFGRGTNGDRTRMLRIARGETEETMQHLNANFRAKRIPDKEYWAIRNVLAVIVKMLNSLARD